MLHKDIKPKFWNYLFIIPLCSVTALLFLNSTCSATSTVSLTVSNNTPTTNAVPGEVAYASSNVTYSANDIEDYSIKISYANGSNGLVLEGGNTTLAGADSKSSSSMLDNTWGYAWSNVDSNNDNLTYSTMPAYGSPSTVESNTVSSITSTTKKIVFAAKFGEDAPNGHYKTNVLLSLVATPDTAVTYTLTYNANGGTSNPSPQTNVSSNATQSFVVASPGDATKSTYSFLGWGTSSTDIVPKYQVGDTITLQSSNPNMTLYAIWGYILSYNANGGQNPPSPQYCVPQSSTYCEVIISSEVPTREVTAEDAKNCINWFGFKEWRVSATGTAGTSFGAGDSFSLSSNTTLYARWTSYSTPCTAV